MSIVGKLPGPDAQERHAPMFHREGIHPCPFCGEVCHAIAALLARVDLRTEGKLTVSRWYAIVY